MLLNNILQAVIIVLTILTAMVVPSCSGHKWHDVPETPFTSRSGVALRYQEAGVRPSQLPGLLDTCSDRMRSRQASGCVDINCLQALLAQ